MLRLYTVSFFGHRIIEDFNRVEKKAETLIRDLILQKGYVEFLVGRGGDFDQIVSSAVKRFQRRIRADNSSLVWIFISLKVFETIHCKNVFKIHWNAYLKNTENMR